MSSDYIGIPSYGNVNWKAPVSTSSFLPIQGNTNGDARITLNSNEIYIWSDPNWLPVASPAAVTAITALLNSSDVTATGPGAVAATVNSVGGKTSGQISQSVSDTQAATNLNTVSTIVKRDSSGNIDSPTFTGVPTAPTAGVGTSTTQLATTAFVLSQGFTGASGSIPSTNQSSTSVITSATTTYVTAISTTITVTATTAPVYAKATATLTTTTAASVAKYRISINGVAGQEQLISLTTTATNYTAVIQYISAALNAGTYTVLFEIARNSGTGTVNFFEGTLDAIALQGASSNGITTLTGNITAGPGSGSQVASITPNVITNNMINSAAAIAYSKLASLSTGQLLVGNAGVPTATTLSGDATVGTTGVLTIANLAITNAKIANTTIDLTTKVTGTLPFARGGTGATAFPNQRIPFSNGTNLLSDSNFLYDTTNNRLIVGGSGTFRINAIVSSGSTGALQAYSEGSNNCLQLRNNNAYAIATLTANNTATAGSLIGFGRSRGTQTSRTQSLNGDTVLNFVGSGYTGALDTGDTGGYNNQITFIQTEDATASANGGEMYFSTTPNTTRTPVERIRIKQSGETVFQKAIVTAQYTTTNKNALTPSAGWIVYDTDLNKLSYYNGSIWVNL